MRLSRDKKHKAQWLRKWAQQEGVAQLSIDEAEQLVLADALPPALAELWARKAGEQRMVGALLAACSRGDLAALQVRPPLAPGLSGVRTGRQVLQVWFNLMWQDGVEGLLVSFHALYQTSTFSSVSRQTVWLPTPHMPAGRGASLVADAVHAPVAADHVTLL